MFKKIVLIGGPATGKSSVIADLEQQGFHCMPEVSREVTFQAQKDGIDQLFLEKPLLFSEKLLEGREKQFKDCENITNKHVFFDRGIPSVEAYLKYFNTEYPSIFTEKSEFYKYDKVFYFAPWDSIHESDNERYESFEQAIEIDKFIYDIYLKLGYEIIEVPFYSVKERSNFILKHI